MINSLNVSCYIVFFFFFGFNFEQLFSVEATLMGIVNRNKCTIIVSFNNWNLLNNLNLRKQRPDSISNIYL